MKTVPMWQHRFINAVNGLSYAAFNLGQATFEDRNNPRFAKLHKRVDSVRKAVEKQSRENYKRGCKEGWIAK